MTLEPYCIDKRLLVLAPDATADEAAHAMWSHHVGALIVQDQGHVVGMLTDRDLTCRIVAMGLEPKQTRLHDVMSPEPLTLSADDTEEQAIALMRANHVRRIPIVRQGHAAGIVTLDDLLIAGAIDPQSASEIIESQLAEPAPQKRAGVPYPMREPAQSDDSEADPRFGR